MANEVITTQPSNEPIESEMSASHSNNGYEPTDDEPTENEPTENEPTATYNKSTDNNKIQEQSASLFLSTSLYFFRPTMS